MQSDSTDGDGKGAGESIKVLVRVRPLIRREQGSAKVVHCSEGSTVHIESEIIRLSCKYDRAFDGETTQEQVYAHVQECTSHVALGFNSTLFAYGQTGSGKTFTLFGPEDEVGLYGSVMPATAGIIPRSIRDIFRHVTGRQSDEVAYTIYCSFMQVYNEQLFDLLRDPSKSKPLSVHETAQEGVYIDGLTEFVVDSPTECLALVAQGEANRAIRATNMNQVSSRSHSILQLLVEKEDTKSGGLVRSKLNLVDLAGSEKWILGSDMNQAHISELTSINLSLHTLSRCITALAANAKAGDAAFKHVPFRESKLTRLLKDSLGGNSRTRVIAALSPSVLNVKESVNTLKFADSAAQVMTHARVNTTIVPDRILVQRLQAEVDHLRRLLQSSAKGGGDGAGMAARILDLEEQLRQAHNTNAQLTAALEQAQAALEQTVGSAAGSPTKGGGVAGNGSRVKVDPEASRMAHDALEKVKIAAQRSSHAAVQSPPSLPGKGGGGGSGSGASYAVAEARAELAGSRAEAKALRTAVESLKRLTSLFFDLEVEEEELQEGVARVWQELKTKSDQVMREAEAERARVRDQWQQSGGRGVMDAASSPHKSSSTSPSHSRSRPPAPALSLPPSKFNGKVSRDKWREGQLTDSTAHGTGSGTGSGIGAASSLDDAFSAMHQRLARLQGISGPRSLSATTPQAIVPDDFPQRSNLMSRDGSPLSLNTVRTGDGQGGRQSAQSARTPRTPGSPGGGGPRGRTKGRGGGGRGANVPASPIRADVDGLPAIDPGSRGSAVNGSGPMSMDMGQEPLSPSSAARPARGVGSVGQSLRSAREVEKALPPRARPGRPSQGSVGSGATGNGSGTSGIPPRRILGRVGGKEKSRAVPAGTAGKLKFRIRGKGVTRVGDEDDGGMEVCGGEEEEAKRLKRELKLARAEMEKSRKLQQWLEEKAKREEGAALAAQKQREAIAKAAAKKEQQRLRRIKKQKQALQKHHSEQRAYLERSLAQAKDEEARPGSSGKKRVTRRRKHRTASAKARAAVAATAGVGADELLETERETGAESGPRHHHGRKHHEHRHKEAASPPRSESPVSRALRNAPAPRQPVPDDYVPNITYGDSDSEGGSAGGGVGGHAVKASQPHRRHRRRTHTPPSETPRSTTPRSAGSKLSLSSSSWTSSGSESGSGSDSGSHSGSGSGSGSDSGSSSGSRSGSGSDSGSRSDSGAGGRSRRRVAEYDPSPPASIVYE